MPDDLRAIVAGLVRATIRRVAQTVADLDAGIDALAWRNPAINRDMNHARLAGTVALPLSTADAARQQCRSPAVPEFPAW